MSGDEGWVLWLTGLPASGKTVLARALRERLVARSDTVVLLDSDELRPVLTPQPVYTPGERDHFYASLAGLAALLARYGANVIIAATATRRDYRDAARRRISRFAEVYVRCPLEVCQARDPKGLYARAAAGELVNMPGLGDPYEPSDAPEAVVETDRMTVDEAIDYLFNTIPLLDEGRTPGALSALARGGCVR